MPLGVFINSIYTCLKAQIIYCQNAKFRHKIKTVMPNTPIIRLSDKSEKLTIRCADALKRAVGKRAIDEALTMEEFCVTVLAAALGFEIERDNGGSANSAA